MWRESPPLAVAVLGLAMAAFAHRRARRAAAQAEALARHVDLDPLTGLPNRVAVTRRLARSLGAARRTGKRSAVLFLDLDGFKAVNDLHGHEAGDAVLVLVAEALAGAVRADDLVGRLGGDEFVVICDGLERQAQAETIADRISMALGRPFRHGSIEVEVTASVGIAVLDGRSATPESTLRDADAAMYRAKRERRGGHVVFDPAVGRLRNERAAREERIARAIDDGELRLHYQPVVRIGDTGLAGVEALLRWAHPVRGIVPPAEFVPLLEETGLIVPAGEWVLREACRQVAEWAQRHGAPPGFHVAVNVSGVQLARGSFSDTVAAALDDTGARPGQLCLEITEAALMSDVAAAWGGLRRVKALGVRLSLDDFGTGYSSLSYVRNFALDQIKVDGSFVGSLCRSPEDAAIVEAIVRMAHALGIGCVAEGVETPQQLERLRELGCDHAQGYLFGEPRPAEAITGLLTAAPAPEPVSAPGSAGGPSR